MAAAVAKASQLRPLEPIRVDTTSRAVVVGAGVAGLRAASDLARAGIEVALIERGATLGGNASVLDRLFPNEESAADVVTRLVDDVLAQERVTIYTEATVESVGGYVGNFTADVRQAMTGSSSIDGDARVAAPVTGRFEPFEGYVLDQPSRAPVRRRDGDRRRGGSRRRAGRRRPRRSRSRPAP